MTGIWNLYMAYRFFSQLIIFLAVQGALSAGISSGLAVEKPGVHKLSGQIEYFIDKAGSLGIAEAAAQVFKKNEKPAAPMNFGYTKDAIWVRFHAANASKIPLWYLRSGALVDSVALYRFVDGAWRERKLGRFEAFSGREVAHRDLIFRLHDIAEKGETFYLRFASAGNVTVDLELVDLETFSGADHDAQFAFGLYFGIMFIMVGYNLFLFLSTREGAYLWYVCYAFTFTLLHLSINGYIAEYAFPRQRPLPHLLTPFFISSAGVFSVLFTRKIIGLDATTGHLNTLSRILAVLFAVAVLAAFVAPYSIAMRAATYSTLISILGLTYCGIRRLIDGQRGARYFLLGWLALYVGIAAMLLRNLGLLPHNFFTAYAMQIFSAAEVMLFSLALGDRFNQLREDSLKLKEVERELDIARRMQMALVPPVTLRAPRVDIAHCYIPMLAVGGDFMDIRITEEGISLFIGDVSGHGLAAAMIATTMKLSLDTEGDKYRAPASRLSRLNDGMEGLPDSAFVTASSAHFSLKTGELMISSAGHPPVLVYHAGQKKCARYKPKGQPLGVAERATEYAVDYTQLGAGDIVLFYTDGIVEQGAGTGNEFGFERIEAVLSRYSALSAHALSERLLMELETFSGKNRAGGFDDDVAFVILKVES